MSKKPAKTPLVTISYNINCKYYLELLYNFILIGLFLFVLFILLQGKKHFAVLIIFFLVLLYYYVKKVFCLIHKKTVLLYRDHVVVNNGCHELSEIEFDYYPKWPPSLTYYGKFKSKDEVLCTLVWSTVLSNTLVPYDILEIVNLVKNLKKGDVPQNAIDNSIYLSERKIDKYIYMLVFATFFVGLSVLYLVGSR